MKNSVIIVTFFILGIVSGRYSWVSQKFFETDLSIFALYGLMFLVGIGIGVDRNAWKILKMPN